MALNDSGGTSPGVAALKASLADLIAESQALRSDVHQAEEARRRASRMLIVVLVAMAVPLVILLGLVAQTNAISREVHDTNEVIADCTSPTGRCAQEGSRRTGEAIGDIIRAEIYMAQCARVFPGIAGPEYDRKLEGCVYARLAEAARQRAAGNPNPTPTLTAPPTPPSAPAPSPSPSKR